MAADKQAKRTLLARPVGEQVSDTTAAQRERAEGEAGTEQSSSAVDTKWAVQEVEPQSGYLTDEMKTAAADAMYERMAYSPPGQDATTFFDSGDLVLPTVKPTADATAPVLTAQEVVVPAAEALEALSTVTTGKPPLLVRYTNEFTREIGYGTDGAAGIDLRACMAGCRNRGTRLSAGTVTMFGSGVAVAIPEGHVGLVIMRSGKSAKDGIQLANQVAVIDSDYRGEIMLPLTTNRTEGAFVANGERVAQLVIVPCVQAEITKVSELEPRSGSQKLGHLEILRADQLEVHTVLELPETARGEGGFGSTGQV